MVNFCTNRACWRISIAADIFVPNRIASTPICTKPDEAIPTRVPWAFTTGPPLFPSLIGVVIRNCAILSSRPVAALTAALVVRIGVTNFLLISHPACTCVIPATTKPKHLVDNLGAAYGHLPDAKTRRRMAEFMAQL